jgi:hypothetical protein
MFLSLPALAALKIHRDQLLQTHAFTIALQACLKTITARITAIIDRMNAGAHHCVLLFVVLGMTWITYAGSTVAWSNVQD